MSIASWIVIAHAASVGLAVSRIVLVACIELCHELCRMDIDSLLAVLDELERVQDGRIMLLTKAHQ